MAALDKLPLDAQIALVEKRMALRRERIAENLEDTRAEAARLTERATRWLPVVGAVGALALGFAVARKRRQSAAQSAVQSARSALSETLGNLRTRYARATAPVATPATRGVVATILALGAASLRFALSSEGRLAWRAFVTAKDHAQRYRRPRPGAPPA